jgi:hypothetical protein
MDTIPYELQAEILCADFATFRAAIRSPLGLLTTHSYTQAMAKSKFIVIVRTENGYKQYVDNRLHSINDMPAVIKIEDEYYGKKFSNGDKCVTENWYCNNKKHRGNNMPASNNSYDVKKWYKNGLPHHANDSPAKKYISANMWYLYGKPHRDNDLPSKIYSSIEKCWYRFGKRHRRCLHADEYKNSFINFKCYYRGKLHRDNNLPAIEYYDGSSVYYFNGVLYDNNKIKV